MRFKDAYEKIYRDMKNGKYDITVTDGSSFKMKTSISLIGLLKDCDKGGIEVESFLRYAKERDGGTSGEGMGSL